MIHNPPKHDPDMPNHELYAQEGHTKFYRPKYSKPPHEIKEHESTYWEKDHS